MTDLDSKVKGGIVYSVLSGDSLQEECALHSFEDAAGRKRHQAVARSKIDANVACVFSLPTDGFNVYVTLSDADPALVRRVLATLEETEAETAVNLGNVVLMNSTELQAVNVVGVILLPPNVSNALNHLPRTLEIGGRTYRFLLIVFLTDAEHEVWRTQGHDALMDLFSSTNKDLVAFGTQPPRAEL